MSRVGIELVVELAVRGPILVHSSEIGPWGVDAVALRDSDGRLVIPGDAVQGKVREAYDEIGGDPFGDEWSRRQSMAMLRQYELAEGRTAEAAEQYETYKQQNLNAKVLRYPMVFSDFTSVDTWPTAGVQTISQTAIDSDTGSAKGGSLRVFDCPVQAGQIARFTGTVHFFSEDETTAATTMDRLVQTLNWVLAFGSQRSVGFGRHCDDQHQAAARIVGKTVTDFDKIAAVEPPDAAAQSVLVDFTFRDPLCLPCGVVNGNTYESRDEIPGEVLRGALAELLKQIGGLPTACCDISQAGNDHPFKTLCDAFDRVRMTTARPTKAEDSRDVRIQPNSLAFVGDRLFDFVLEKDLTETSRLHGRAAAFRHDWKPKHHDAANEYFGTAFPRQELRVRTSIDEEGRRRAKTHNLFAYRMVRPEGLHWRAVISIDDRPRDGNAPDESQRQQIISQLLSLLQSGWLSVGKTRAHGTGRLVEARPAPKPVQPLKIRSSEDDVFVITLRGPALMIDPRECVDENGFMKCLEEINALYAKYWQQVSDETLAEIPERRFKIDSLVGGFQARKYRYSPDPNFDMSAIANPDERVRIQGQFPYNPSLILEPGSVFVLKLADGKALADAQAKITEWLSHGLPLPEWAKRAYGDTHHTNIFLPQNGFGEIDVNLDCHTN